MRTTRTSKAKWFFIGLLMFLSALAALSFLLSSCNSSKDLFKSNSDSTGISRQDSGAVKSNTSSEKKEGGYTKETFVFPPAPRDCTINNYYNYPSTIIRETGNYKEEKAHVGYDSSWEQKADSSNVSKDTSELHKETQVLNLWHVIGICAGFFILQLLLQKFKISFRK